MMIIRNIGQVLKRLSGEYPVVTLTGPRQSGKTTLCKNIFPDKPYYSLEKPDVRRRIISDPNSFMEQAGDTVIIDEIQRVPDLFSYIQTHVDEHKKNGQFILTGSSQFELHKNISQSLAGRTALLTLLPFSMDEIYPGNKPKTSEIIYKGFYPAIFDKKLNPTEALGYYSRTYIERDVRELLKIRELSSFETFVKLCAGRTGQILNLNSLGADCGINHNTAKSWLSVLNASYITCLLRPHHKNFNKRLVKAPKLYFLDTGLLSYQLDITAPEQIDTHPLKGALFETLVVSELKKQIFNGNKPDNIYYWRDNTGNEIDIIMDFGDKIIPVEIKSSKTIADDFFKNLKFYFKLNPSCPYGIIIYGGNETFRENKFRIVSYKDINLSSLL